MKRITQSDVLNFHDFVENKSCWEENSYGEKVGWNDLVELNFNGNEPGIIRYKTNFEVKDWKLIQGIKVLAIP